MDIAEEKRDGVDFIADNGEREVLEEIEEEKSSERQIDVVDSARDDLKRSISPVSTPGKIFVGGVSWETNEDIFTKHFEKYGEIIDSVIMKEKHTGRPRGFGFITFANSSVLDKVLEDEHVINGRTVEVKRTVPREEMQVKESMKTKKIFVGGILPSITEDELAEYFSSYGNIVEHQIMLDHNTGRSRGFGFVTFESENAVEEIMSEGKAHELGGKQVEIKKAEPKRGGGDQGGDARGHYGGGFTKSYGSYGSGNRSGGRRGGRSGGGYGGGHGRGYGAAGPTSFYDGYGGYGSRVGLGGGGYGGSIYGNAGYGDDEYGTLGGYGGAYGGSGGYVGGYGGGGGGGGGGYRGGYGGAYSGNGGYAGYGSGVGGAAASGRYHPYGR